MVPKLLNVWNPLSSRVREWCINDVAPARSVPMWLVVLVAKSPLLQLVKIVRVQRSFVFPLVLNFRFKEPLTISQCPPSCRRLRIGVLQLATSVVANNGWQAWHVNTSTISCNAARCSCWLPRGRNDVGGSTQRSSNRQGVLHYCGIPCSMRILILFIKVIGY